MKISNSKKELARIISKSGGWCDGAKLAVFGPVSKKVKFSRHHEKPVTLHKSRGLGKGWEVTGRIGSWMESESIHVGNPFPNWHQTILSREEYFHLYPAPDADGWIEWRGGECPVDVGSVVDVRQSDGLTYKARAANFHWNLITGSSCVVAYRLHKQAGPEFCESVMRSIPAPESKPTIEQLAVDYRNKLDYANRKQDEADKANMDSDAALSELEAAIAAIGFAITPLAATEKDPELVITDWRDLQVGDEVEAKCHAGTRIGLITELESVGYEGYRPFRFQPFGDTPIWCTSSKFKFIRRP